MAEESENIVLEEEEDNLIHVDVLFDESEIGRLVGHTTTPVQSLSYASIAGLLLTGSDDETVRLFNVATRTHLANVNSGLWVPTPVRAVAISPDASHAFIAARQNTIQMVRLSTSADQEQSLSAFVGHDHWVRSLSLNWERRMLASASNDFTVRLWDIDSGTEIRRYFCNARAIAVSLNDRMVVVGVHDPVVRGFRLDDDMAVPLEFLGHTDWVTSVALGRSRLLTGSNDKTGRVFDPETQDCICVLRGHQLSVNAVALCPTETRGLTGSNDSSVVYWSFENGGVPLLRISSNFGSVRAIVYLRTTNEICFSGWDGSIRIFDLHVKDNMRIKALCYAGHERLGKSAEIRRIINRDLLSRIRSFLLKTPEDEV